MSEIARANGWRGFDSIGEKVERVMGVRDSKTGWLYRCDGMPGFFGCGEEMVISRRLVRVGEKKSGWLVCYGTTDGPGDDGKGNDLDVVLTFCRSCAAAIKEREGATG
jgi:hypothetical protein